MAIRTKPDSNIVQSAVELVNGHMASFCEASSSSSVGRFPREEWQQDSEPQRAVAILPNTIEPMTEAVSAAYLYLAVVFSDEARHYLGDTGNK